ncbi:MAG: hypothetical protein IPM14_14565 [bacterium]|nr:hypothetical protein [bacterium]
MKKHSVKYLVLLSLLLLVFISQNCDDSLTSSDIDNIVMPDSNVSYLQHVAPVFEVKCVPCHNDQRSEGGVNLSSWTNVTNPNIVIPGDDSSSVLVWTVERLYKPMPPNESLKRNHINGIRIWIREGAQYN